MGHVAMPGPSRTGRWVWSRRTRGDTGTIPCRVAGPVPRGMWRRQSPLTLGGGSEAVGYMVTPEPFPAGW
jgi:hypothetical protein